jgi:hypothetical protein
MCTYQTARLGAQGSAKGPEGWFPLTDVTVYFDHPVSAPRTHTLNIDFSNWVPGPRPGLLWNSIRRRPGILLQRSWRSSRPLRPTS